MKHYASKEMVENALGEEYDEMAEPPYVEWSGREDLRTAIRAALKEVYDPEIPVNIYELGLIYKVDVSGEGDVFVEMTLTSPGCPVAGEMPGWVEAAVQGVESTLEVKVDLVFDPPWDPSKMAETAKLELNMF